jgi:hypothetical protein
MPDINLAPTNYDLEAIQKRRRMAELLMQQAQQPLEMPQTPGVRISPVSGLAKLLQTYTANEKLKKADIEEKQYQSDYLSDLGFLMRNAGKTTPATEAIPEKTETITTPIEANRNFQEVALRQSPARLDPNAAINPFEKQIFQGMDKGQTSEKLQEISQMPGQTVEERVTPAVPAIPGSPLLSPDLLSGNNANNYIKTGAGKMALAQYLMQQQAQQQAAAQAELVASRQLQAFNPEQNVGTFSGGQFKTIIQGQPKPMTDAQRLDAELKQFAAEVEADKAQDVGRPARAFERLPKGVPVGAKKIGKDKDTGKDVYKLNNELFVGD